VRLGLSYDWSRELATCDPAFFVHEQRIFVEMWKRGLAYRKDALVNWCESCGTVLANEQVEDGHCWRCRNPVAPAGCWTVPRRRPTHRRPPRPQCR
jgi:leucyl-tRNA synthetase